MSDAVVGVQRALTQAAFAAWLDTKPRDEDVGEIGNPGDCPVATYLGECGFVGLVQPHAVDLLSETGDTVAEVPMPAWAGQFVLLVDDEKGAYVAASRALDLLDLAIESVEEAS